MLASTPVFIGLLLPSLLASPLSEQGVSVFPDLDDKLFKNEERTHDPSFPLSFKLSHFPNIGEHLKPEENSLLKKGGRSFRKPLEFDDFLVDSLENEAEPSQIVENGDDSKNLAYDDFDEQLTSEEVSKKKQLPPDYDERHAENEESSGSLEDEGSEEEGYSVEESRASRMNQSEYSGESKNPKCEGNSCEAPDYDNNSAEQETDYEENESQSSDAEENEEDPSRPVASQEDGRVGDRGKAIPQDAAKTAFNHSESISKPVVYLQKQKSPIPEEATKRSSQIHRLTEPESSQVEAEDISIDSFELNPDVMKPPPSSGEEQQSIEPTRSDESVEQRHGSTETLSQAKRTEETTSHLRLRPSPPPTLGVVEPGGTLVRRIIRPPPPPTRPGPLLLHPHQTHLYTQVESPTRASGNWNAMMAARQATALTYLKPPPLGQPQTWAVRRHIPHPIYHS